LNLGTSGNLNSHTNSSGQSNPGNLGNPGNLSNLSKQIKELRQHNGLSQEALAERIYVTRQTVSNWETGRNYPDIQSLLLLSVLFDVSLDELVKGDIDMMKKELEANRMIKWTWVGIICCALGALCAVPLHTVYGFIGLIPAVALFAIAITALIILSNLRKKHHLDTYAKIVAFYDGKPIDAEKIAKEKQHKKLVLIIKFVVGAAAGALLALVGMWIGSLIIG